VLHIKTTVSCDVTPLSLIDWYWCRRDLAPFILKVEVDEVLFYP
jgi:hypothetical protein